MATQKLTHDSPIELHVVASWPGPPAYLAITADEVHHSSLVVGVEANVEEVPSTRMLGGHHV